MLQVLYRTAPPDRPSTALSFSTLLTRAAPSPTVFTGTTEVGAVDALASLPGAEVRVSVDVRRTRHHATAWRFHRNTSLHTAYVGSANLTSTALGSG